MEPIRKATANDASRLAEILIFTKRIHYRSIFNDDKVSFGAMQVLPLAQEYLSDETKLENIWVYDDEFVKGMINIEGDMIQELYIDSFFQHKGIGAKLIDFAIHQQNAKYLWVLEKNHSAIKFYQAHGFLDVGERKLQPGTEEVLMKMGI